MLFSNDLVAPYINRYFEPVWEMVRPVPIVRIDFGDNRIVTRTLHGNIATSVCTAEGQTLDILPGIYTPIAYQQNLEQFRLLADYFRRAARVPRESSNDRLTAYHRQAADALAKKEPPPYFVNTAGLSKAAIERTIAVLVSGNNGAKVPFPERQALAKMNGKVAAPKLDSSEELANWNLLVEDTRQNETVRRRQIHEILAAEIVKPAQVTKRLYKEVLHTDLDDPYLGLGATLFAHDPFARDDR